MKFKCATVTNTYLSLSHRTTAESFVDINFSELKTNFRFYSDYREMEFAISNAEIVRAFESLSRLPNGNLKLSIEHIECVRKKRIFF